MHLPCMSSLRRLIPTPPTMMKSSFIVGLTMALWVTAAQAQYAPDKPDWIEDKAVAPPAYSKDHLIPIDMPGYVSMRVGIDPTTVSIGGDGVVRYVVVMRNASGSGTAAYEGIRCTTDEVKTYARVSAADAWVTLSDPQWKAINDNLPSKHAFTIARQGGCNTHLSGTLEETLRALRQNQKVVR